jgi:hypothetical protein
MKSELQRDLRHLDELAFHRVQACGDLITQFHRLPARAKRNPYYPLMETVRLWLLSPFSLWPIDFAGVGKHILVCIRNGKKLDPQMGLLLSFLTKTPLPKEQAAIGAHELQVRTGNYETLITAQRKFTYKEEILTENPVFKADWEAIKSKFNVTKYRDPKGIIRRRMVQERSFRPHGWEFRWRKLKNRFDVVFDAFCHQWILYGMEGDRPLLQKLSINVTPLGTMIFIPRYWSFDWRRDLKWGAVTKLHRSRGVHRQGEKLSSGEVERIKEAFKIQALWKKAKMLGLRGESRKDWVMKEMGWLPDNDFSKVRRLLKLADRFTTYF